MKDSLYGELSVIGMKGCEDFSAQVDAYLQEWRKADNDGTYLVEASCPRFGSGEAKGTIHQSLRGNDVYIISDVFNPVLTGITVTLNGVELDVGTGYTYNVATGEFATVDGIVTVPAATYTQDPTTGAVTTVPGVTVLTVSGTV